MKGFLNWSIRRKLIFIEMLVALVAIILAFAIVISNDINLFKQELIDQTRLTARLVAEYSVVPLIFGYSDEAKETLKKVEAIPSIDDAVLYDLNKTIFAEYSRKKTTEYPSNIPDLQTSSFDDNHLVQFVPVEYDGLNYGTLMLRVSRKALDEKIRGYLLTMIPVTLIVLLVAYLLAMWLQNVFSNPILKLANLTDEITRNKDFTLRAEKHGEDEIGRLVDGFNNMLEQIHIRKVERDVAENAREKLLSELEEKNRELGQIIYVTSHDLRSPLVNIQGFSNELAINIEKIKKHFDSLGEVEPDKVRSEIEPILDEEIPESLEFISRGITKMDSLLSGLLRLSRLGRAALNITRIDMNQLMEDVVSSFEYSIEQKNIQLDLDALPPCMGDRIQINQVFSNLIANAINYMNNGRQGKIWISGKADKNKSIYVIKDNGIGISLDYHEKIFEIFHRLNPDSTEGEGLGLTIVSKILERHNGRIWVESKKGEGSTFYVSLPSVGANVDE